MPTYQYACRDCDHSFEAAQSFSDDSLTVCPSCQGRLRKVFNAVGVVFKGSGFYRTDSRSEAKAAAKTADAKTEAAKTSSSETSTSSESSSGSAKSDSNGSAKSDSKPAATPKSEAGAA